jgi:hypothetical protein
MKPADKPGPRNMGTDGKTRPPTTHGVASPRANTGELKEAKGIVRENPKEAGEGVIERNRKS